MLAAGPSLTLKVKLAWEAPFAFAAGVNPSRPASISAFGTHCPAVTAVPDTASSPTDGSATIFTATSSSPLSASAKPKSPTSKA